MNLQAQHVEIESLDPPEPTSESLEVLDPASVIQIDSVMASVEGITAQDVTEAILLEAQSLSITVIGDDVTEEHVGDLLRDLAVVDLRIENKGRRWCDLAFKLHRGLTGLFGPNGNARQHTQAGIKHLRPLLASRLQAKLRMEQQRQREERERAQAEERERKLQEAAHVESTGGSAEEVNAIIEEAETLPPPPVAAQPITNLRGVSTRDNWKCEVMGPEAVVKFMAANFHMFKGLPMFSPAELAKALTPFAKAQKSGLSIPGARAFNDPVLSQRR